MIVEFFTKYGFIVEYLIAIAILVYPLTKRRMFVLRVLGVLIAFFLYAFLWNLLFDVTMLSVIIRHTTFYMIGIGGIMFCFKTGIWSSVFFGAAALTIQHIAYKIGYTIRSLADLHSEEYLGIFFYVLITIIVYLLAFIFMSNKLKDEENFHLKNNNKEILLSITALILFSTIFQNVFEYLIEQSDILLIITLTSYDLVSCILIIILIFTILRSSKLYHDTQVLEHILDLQQNQMDNAKNNIDILNIKYHDLKYILSSFKDRISEDDMASLNEALGEYDLYLKTGNEALDILLAEKRLHCEPQNIRINCIADGKIINFIPPSKVYSLFGNAVDNAINAIQDIDKEEQRIINITVKETKGFVSIIIENYYKGHIIFKDDLPVTSKSNRLLHGFGLKSVKMIVEEYNGYMTVKTENNKFILSILLQK